MSQENTAPPAPQPEETTPPMAEPRTREEAIAVVTAIGRHCRGGYRSMDEVKTLPPTLRRPIREAMTLAIAQLELSETEASDPKFVISTLLAEGQMDQANQLDTVLRAPCGYDINELIIAGGFDGEEHTEACPQCGLKLSWRAPWFPGLEGGA